MSRYLVDTNVVSELLRPVPEPRVMEFLRSESDLWLSAVAVHELDYGVRRLPTGSRQGNLRRLYLRVTSQFSGRILTVDQRAAEQAARLRANAAAAGMQLALADGLMAGTANAYDLAIATRNVRHFEGLGIHVLNPWDL